MMEMDVFSDGQKKKKLKPRSRSSAANLNGLDPQRLSPEPPSFPPISSGANRQRHPAPAPATDPSHGGSGGQHTKTPAAPVLRALPTVHVEPSTPAINATPNSVINSSPYRDRKQKSDVKNDKIGVDTPRTVHDPHASLKAIHDPSTDRRMAELMTLWKEFQLTVQEHNRRTREMDEKMMAIESNVDRFGKFCGEYQLIWKIKNFASCYEDAVTERRIAIPSPVFDTHRNGYKLQLSLCPNGDGKGKGDWLSMFFAILKGPYDSLLQWPFTCPVTMTLLEQVADPNTTQPHDIAMTFTPNPRPDNEPFLGQPKTERNLSLGFPKFLALQELFEGEYIKEDTIYIKVRVDLADVIAL